MEGVRRPKLQLELTPVPDIKGNKKNFYCDISNKRLNKESVGPLLNGMGGFVTAYTDKAEAPSALFASVFTNKKSLASALSESVQELPAVDVDWGRGNLRKLDL